MVKTASKTINYLKLIAALLFWGGLYHVAKPAAEAADPFIVAFLRYLIASILLLIVLRIKSGKLKPNLNLRQWLLIISIGTIGICFYNIFFMSAEALISGNIVAILYAFAPCLTTIISSYLFKTHLNWLCKLGIVLALLGSIGVVNFATPGCEKLYCTTIFSNINRGEIYGILATVVFACYSVLSKCASHQNISGLVINTYAAVVGCILLGVISLFTSNYSEITTLGSSFWLALLYMSVLATVIAYLWYIDALINLGVFKTVVFQNTLPLQTVLIGYLFFHEKVSFGELACGGVVLAGVYLTNYALTMRKD